MRTLIAAVFAFVGAVLGCGGLLLMSAVVAVLMQGKPLDLISTVLALILIGLAAFALRAAWRRLRHPL